MDDITPGRAFRGLPLTSEQDQEIKHYIHTKGRRGEPWDTPELQAMLGDMLDPPEVLEDKIEPWDESTAAECTTAETEESTDTDRHACRRSS